MTTLGIDVGKKNLGMCLIHKKAIVDWTVMSFRSPSAKDVFQGLSASDFFAHPIGRCVIEKQPPRNPTMCRIQHYLEFWCASKGIPVKIQDARVKLTHAATLPSWDHRFDTSTYYQRKRTAVKVVEGLVKEQSQWLDFYNRHSKKDDLADSYLHALAYDAKTQPQLQTQLQPQLQTQLQTPPANATEMLISSTDTPLDFTGVCARKPGERTKSLKKSHVKWLVCNHADHPDLRDAITRYFS